jgi:hypothetical protein
MYKQLNKCPVCGENLTVTRLYCTHCDTTVNGHFDPAVGPFAQLNPEQTQFVVQFVRCEGRFTRLEEELNLSYPTLRNRLNEIVRAMGFEPGKEESPVRLSVDERRQILEDLDNGKITPTEAQRQLRGK